jgi:uncharacterized protein (TIGR00369 family)
MSAEDAGPPAGFVPLVLDDNPFMDLVGPLYGHRDEGLAGRLVLGVRVQPRHCSPSGYCHGGMLATLADMLVVLGCNVQADPGRFMSTVSLSTDFLAPVPCDAWIEGRLEVLRATRNLIFCQGLFRVDGQPVLRVDGIARPIGEPDPGRDARRHFG